MDKLLEYLQGERGRTARVAKEARIASAYLSQIASGRRPAAPAHVAAIERACSFQVRRWHLRPDDWYRIWPELMADPLAPVIGEPALTE